MTPIISQFNDAMSQKISFSVYKDKSEQWHIKTRSVWNQIFFWKDSKYEAKRINRIAKMLNQEIRKSERLKIKTALTNQSIKVARNFLKRLAPRYQAEPHVVTCRRQLLAAKLGIKTEIFLNNPGFEEFVSKSHLERYLVDYDDEIRIDDTSKEIYLKLNGKYQPWSRINKEIDQLPTPQKSHFDNPQQMWYYGPNGIQKKDMYVWDKLKPYKTVEPTWGNRYIFEFNACCSPSLALIGDHSWIELKTPEGKISSVGLYLQVKSKSNILSSGQYPLALKKGYLMSPEVSNWWPTTIYRIPVEITKEQFEIVKHSIEQDKLNEEQRHFQLFKGNCQEYVNEKAILAGIKLNTSVFILRNITPIQIQKVYDKVIGYFPKFVHRILFYSVSFFLNVTHWALGGSVVNKCAKIRNVKAKPLMRSFWDLFNPQNLYFHPPRHVALAVKKEIDNWRNEQIQALPEDKVKEREAIKYQLPPQYSS